MRNWLSFVKFGPITFTSYERLTSVTSELGLKYVVILLQNRLQGKVSLRCRSKGCCRKYGASIIQPWQVFQSIFMSMSQFCPNKVKIPLVPLGMAGSVVILNSLLPQRLPLKDVKFYLYR